MTKSTATIAGCIAILLWALLALFTVATQPIPPLQLTSMTFAIGGVLGLIWTASTGGLPKLRKVSWKVYVFGITGLFGYHILYFTALRWAPAAQAGLIAYLWPLLIVLFSGLLPNEKLKLGHVVGAVLGFAGASIILAGGGGFEGSALPGYGLALLAAFFWSGYSVLSRSQGTVPTESVAVFCLGTALLASVAHYFVEVPQWPSSPTVWMAVIGLGLGPVGLAFYVWDLGMKKGNIQLLGVASYAAPVLSTFALVIFGLAPLTFTLSAAALLITFGALVAAFASRAPQ